MGVSQCVTPPCQTIRHPGVRYRMLLPNVREAFELNRFQNLTYNEIAERLGVSPKTIDYRIQQALKQLRIDLKEYLPLLLPFLLH